MLSKSYSNIHKEATLLAGLTTDLEQRARTYFHMYQHSGGNNIFPLIAAHGALWGKIHFERGQTIGKICALQYYDNPKKRRQQLDALETLAEDFREINRQVCVQSYAAYHITDRHPDIAQDVFPHNLVSLLVKCHTDRKEKKQQTSEEKRALYEALFRWEQKDVVSDAVAAAVKKLDWPFIKFLVLRPPIGLKYFPKTTKLYFKNFANKDERIEKGLQAFDLAEKAGWEHVVKTLGNYKTLPKTYAINAQQDFFAMRKQILNAA